MNNVKTAKKKYGEHMEEVHGAKVPRRTLIQYFQQIYWPFNFTEEELNATLKEYDEKFPGYSQGKFGLDKVTANKKKDGLMNIEESIEAPRERTLKLFKAIRDVSRLQGPGVLENLLSSGQ